MSERRQLKTGRAHRRLGLAVLAMCLCVQPMTADAADVVSSGAGGDGYVYEISRLTEHVHVIAQPEAFHLQPLGNVTVVEQTDGFVLVDAGGSRGAGERIVELVRQIGDKPIKAVILTHWHGDHPLGVSAILKTWPQARIISTARTRAHLLGSSMQMFPRGDDAAANRSLQDQIDAIADSFRASSDRPGASAEERRGYAQAERDLRRYARDLDGTTLALPGVTFTDQLSLPDEQAPVEALFLGRANTDGDAVVWLPDQRVLAAGDVVVAPFPFGFDSHPAEWLQVLDRLDRFDFAFLVPGHGAVQTDRTYLHALTALIASTRSQAAALAASGASLEEARTRIDLAAHARRMVGDDPWLQHWFRLYWTDPMVASVYGEATGRSAGDAEAR